MIRFLSYLLPCFLLAGCFSQLPAPTVDRTGSLRASSQPTGPGYYTVKPGDTLYRIAVENGQDYRDIAAWNNIVNPGSIKEGQVLRVLPPAAPAQSQGGTVANPIAVGSEVESRPLEQVSDQADGLVKREPRVGKEPYSDEAYARLNRTDTVVTTPAQDTQVTKPAVQATPQGPDDVPWAWPTSAKVTAPFSESSNKGLDFAGKAGDPILAAGDGKVVYAGSGLRGYGELVIIKHNATFLSAYAHNRKILVKEGQQISKGQKIAEMGKTDADSVKLHFEIRKQGKPVDPSQYLPKR